ncbi:MAG: pseudouridine synthase, partial [Anaerolineales bacterium]
TGPAKVWVEDKAIKGPWVRVVLTQGMKRQIRETAEALGLKVKRLVRIRMGSLQLGELGPGTWRDLTDREMILLRSAIER